MSYAMSTRLSRASYVVALVGATGDLGNHVANVFLTSYRPFFSKIVVIARDTTTASAKQLAAQGAELRQVNSADPVQSFAQAFAGVDVVVSLVGNAPLECKDALFDGALKAGVKAYLPSEYGSDYRVNDFPGWDDVAWIAKAKHVRRARELAQGKVKIVAVYTGLFLEGALGPYSSYFGFDTKNLTYTAVGSLDAKTATTTKADIGRSLAELSLLALSPELASQVPDDVHIAGDNVSYRDVQGIAHRVRDELGLNKGDIVLKSEDLEAYRATVREDQLKKPAPGPLRHIRILIAEGKMDFSKNHNELVNPGQKVWKWRTVEEFIRAKGSKFFE